MKKEQRWKAWIIGLMILAVYGLVGEMECRDMERMQQSPIVAAGSW